MFAQGFAPLGYKYIEGTSFPYFLFVLHGVDAATVGDSCRVTDDLVGMQVCEGKDRSLERKQGADALWVEPDRWQRGAVLELADRVRRALRECPCLALRELVSKAERVYPGRVSLWRR